MVTEENGLKILTYNGGKLCFRNLSGDKEETVFHEFYSNKDFNWPYLTMASVQYVWLWNCFNPTNIQVYELPANIKSLVQSKVTDTSELFCLGETHEQFLELYTLDLNRLDP